MTARTRTAKKATTTPAPAKKTTAKRTPAAASRPARKRTPRTPAPERPRLSLVKAPTPTKLSRARDFVTDAQIYATHTARTVGIPIHRIRDWRDHRDNTATRPLRDGSLLHYDHNTRTLTWQAVCRMGATHAYTLTTPSGASAARVHADLCQELHADLTTIQPLTADELEALGLLQTPTWAHKDVIGEPATVSLPVPEEPIHRATSSAADTQPLPLDQIAAGIAARAAADHDTAKEHPQP